MSSTPAPIDTRHFRTVLGHFPTGVVVVTADTGDGPVGMTIGSFTSVSLEPPLVAFLPTHSSTSWLQIQSTGRFCVNILSEHQAEVCSTFASKADDKFAGLDWTRAPATGSPILPDVLGWIDCDIEVAHEAGDHLIVVGRVLDLAAADLDHGPLLFHKGGYGRFDSI